jgi:hypothetical protein
LKKSSGKTFDAIIEDITFLPSPEQRKNKAAFWASYADNPMASSDNVTLALALQTTKEPRLRRWWPVPGFSEWYSNKDEFRQRLEYLANLGLDTIEDILLDPEANANARMNAAKLMLEAASKMPNKWNQEKFLDEHIQKMGQQELESWIAKRLPKELDEAEDTEPN